MLGCGHPSVAEIEALVCIHFDVRLNDMRSERRGGKLSRARQVAMFLARHKTPYSLPHIGRCFNRDHTTVMHAIKRIEQLIADDQDLAEHVAILEARL